MGKIGFRSQEELRGGLAWSVGFGDIGILTVVDATGVCELTQQEDAGA